MYYSDSIITSIQADRILALKLEDALKGVKDSVISNIKQMGDGATRASYYLSCFTDNYQDVCTKLKHEDARFLLGIAQLVKDRNIIFEMIKIYIEINFKNKKEGRIQNIIRKLVNAGVHISSSTFTNRLLVIAIATAICQSYSFSAIVNERISRTKGIAIKAGVTAAAFSLGLYGLVQDAANSADALKKYNVFYYNALYEKNLEMMYFLIEPVISKNPYLNPMLISDDELVDLITRLVR
ncbi:hypothetical protein EH228_14830 [Erwinia endophytica]|uniref:hypothetical protein n=1 Tax=Erwinia endophytica TaxID=1563158 RepID=UPI001265E78C|nr:hypothetical protein [Erwinia endophytica]KAB8307276.1 hypothetical protein EH228_14830 [Erwinia endophytica]